MLPFNPNDPVQEVAPLVPPQPAAAADPIAAYLRQAQDALGANLAKAPVGPFDQQLADFQQKILQMQLASQERLAKILSDTRIRTEVERSCAQVHLRHYLECERQNQMALVRAMVREKNQGAITRDVVGVVLKRLFA